MSRRTRIFPSTFWPPKLQSRPELRQVTCARMDRSAGSIPAASTDSGPRHWAEGLELALSPYRTPRREYRPKLDGSQEARLITLACGAPPEGCARWTLRLLADALVELEVIDDVSQETVRQRLFP